MTSANPNLLEVTDSANGRCLERLVSQPEQFPLVKTENGWRCPGLGEWFQGQCRTPEWRAALTVYDKYRRKLNLEHEHLLELRDYICRRDNLAGWPVAKPPAGGWPQDTVEPNDPSSATAAKKEQP